ncbi:cathepsin L [Nephila pilipes]|uniref:Cathepsin L n=1 Tax=Nephila pilipes TaxID=299642 RepID=A0A8X6MMY4_NEPPI|nr:cathepsin L [Nephila pilipes]
MSPLMRRDKMKFLVIFTLVQVITCQYLPFDRSHENEWNEFKDHFQKSYKSLEDETLRRSIWQMHFHDIIRHNFLADLGMRSYKMGLNAFSDKTVEEMVGSVKKYERKDYFPKKGLNWNLPPVSELPEKLDWRDAGLVTPVKNQEPCGACWAFSTTGSLEGQHMKKTGNLVSLSEQNIIDCSKDNDGCNGGDVNSAFEYTISNGGIDTEASYPYTAKNGTCRFDKASIGASCTGYLNVPDGDEDALKQAVATVGPISVIIDACHNTFINYKSGIFDEPKCRTDIPSHAVLVIGYGTEDGKDYWLVKNSWGTSWGMDGYILMTRNKNNQCGIA